MSTKFKSESVALHISILERLGVLQRGQVESLGTIEQIIVRGIIPKDHQAFHDAWWAAVKKVRGVDNVVDPRDVREHIENEWRRPVRKACVDLLRKSGKTLAADNVVKENDWSGLIVWCEADEDRTDTFIRILLTNKVPIEGLDPDGDFGEKCLDAIAWLKGDDTLI